MCFTNLFILLAGILFIVWGFTILKSAVLIEQPDDDDNLLVALLNSIPFLIVGVMFLLVGSNYNLVREFLEPLAPIFRNKQTNQKFMIGVLVFFVVLAILHSKLLVPWRLKRWANKRGMKLLSYSPSKEDRISNFFTGRNKYQSFYTLEIEEEDGRRYLADVVIGAYWGYNPNKFDVSWEEVSAQQKPK